MKSTRTDCGASNLTVPVQHLCPICETPQPQRRCTPCAATHADRNVHRGVELVDSVDGPTYRRAVTSP